MRYQSFALLRGSVWSQGISGIPMHLYGVLIGLYQVPSVALCGDMGSLWASLG